MNDDRPRIGEQMVEPRAPGCAAVGALLLGALLLVALCWLVLAITGGV